MNHIGTIPLNDTVDAGRKVVVQTESGGKDINADVCSRSLSSAGEGLMEGCGLYIRRKTGIFLWLPPEILLEVFSAVCSAGSNLIPDPRADVPPLLLAHVCRSWRKTALSIPRLWSRFIVDIGYCKLSLLLWYLKHSGDVLLDIVLNDFVDDPDCFFGKKRTIIQALLMESRRWRSAIIEMYSLGEWNRALQYLKWQPEFSKLEKITLWGENLFDSSKENELLQKLFPKVQSIRTLSVPSEPGPYRAIPLVPVELTLCNTFFVLCQLDILEGFPDMKELIIPFYCLTWSFKADFRVKKHFHHRFLTTLSIRFCVEDEDEDYSPYGECTYSLHPFFYTLTLPSLKQLTVFYPQSICDCKYAPASPPRSRPWSSDAFKDMISRSQCELGRLSLIGFPLHPSEIREIICCCPALTTFVFHEAERMDATKYLLDLLANRSSDQPDVSLSLPNLQTLGISVIFPAESESSESEQEADIATRTMEAFRTRRRMNLAPFRLSLDLSRPLLPGTRKILEEMNVRVNSDVLFPMDPRDL
ncbi:hypothetical protein L218DRAFT_964147 [Marasmius fiardii PR-910]|nr:hypothetical protein L218DRAFT_964147 [Marasmius fiardii PR-910]